jgi:adenylate cyclase
MASANQEIFERVLGQERQWNANSLNALRPAALLLFLVPQLILRGITPGNCVLLGYTLLAGGLLLLARNSERSARGSVLAVPFLDMPAVFLKQWVDMDLAEADTRAIATFSLALFVLLVMLSAFTLRTRRLIVAGFVALVLVLSLQAKAGDTALGMIGSVATILTAIALCEVALIRRFDMVRRISEERLQLERLGRYFSPQVALTIQQGTDDFATGQLCEVTVLFSDLRGFAAATEMSTPAEVLSLLNEFHSRMVEIIFTHAGTLDKYLGDGLMAYFGAPLPQSNHALRALHCALAMQTGMTALNLARTEQGKPALRLSVGLHTGPAIIGSIGAANRREFTVVGDTVNLAARMENLTRHYNSDILVSGATAAKIEGQCPLQLVANTHVKGRSEPVQVFAPAAAELANRDLASQKEVVF